MKHVLAEGRLSTMHGVQLTVYRIVLIILFIVGMALPLCAANSASAQVFTEESQCAEAVLNGCQARHQGAWWVSGKGVLF
jgi:hypothetical protein